MAGGSPGGALQDMERLIASGDLPGALRASKLFLSRHRSHPKAARVRERAVRICIKLGDYAEGVRIGEGAGSGADGDAELLYAIAQAYVYSGRGPEAMEAVHRVLRADPDHAPAIARMAVLLQNDGRTADAVALLDDAWARGVRGWDIDHAFAQLGPRVGRTGEAIDRLRARLDSGEAIPRSGRAELLCGLAELLEQTGDFAGSWRAACLAAELMKTAWNAEGHARMIRAIIEGYSPQYFARIAGLVGGLPARDDMLFVVGMPRSGTTLIDQILSAHPEVESAGETTVLNEASERLGLDRGDGPDRLERVGAATLAGAALRVRDRLAELATGGGRILLDKQPFNDRHIGMLASMAPGVRVVLTRRDPRDIALSCFFRNFAGGMEWSNSMAWITRLLEARLELHRHWADVVAAHAPWVCFYEAGYESIVGDPESGARRLVGAMGLGWDDACLRFDQRRRMLPTLQPGQAGRGVYGGSVARWRRFEPYAGGAFDGLHALAERMGYGRA